LALVTMPEPLPENVVVEIPKREEKDDDDADRVSTH